MRLMAEKHNERTTADHVMFLDPTKPALNRLYAAYGVTEEVGESDDDRKKRLIDTLINGRKFYDVAALRAFDEKATAEEKEKAEAESAEATMEAAAGSKRKKPL